MSLNFSQNPQYINQQQVNNNFGAINMPQVQEPVSFSILKGMGLPSNGDEFVKFVPLFGVSVVLSKIFSGFATVASRINPLKSGNEAMTVGESFEKSFLGKLGKKIDNILFPFFNKHKGRIDSVTTGAKKITPQWIKNLWEKFKIGTEPKCNMALFQYRGATHAASNAFFDVLTKVKPEELIKLGIAKTDVADILKLAQSAKTLDRKALLAGIEFVADKFNTVKAKDLQEVLLQTGKKSFLLNELNKARAFIAPNAKTGVSKYLQKGLMYLAEGAGGGVIGGALLGIIMNSIFMASAIKRTWEAPWKEKLSTFMEGFIVEFGGIYFTMVLGTRLTYKLLGLKNADKTAAQLAEIKGLRETINASKGEFKDIEKVLKLATKGNISAEQTKAISGLLEGINVNGLSPEVKELIDKTLGKAPIKQGFWARLFRRPVQMAKPVDLTKEEIIKVFENLKEVKGTAINSSIDNLAKMQAFKKIPKGGFFRNLFNRPLRWIGNFLCTGLENLPTKVAVNGVSKKGIFFKNIWNLFKSGAGFPIRFLLVTAIVTPPLTNFLGKVSHTLFGKPTKSVMDEKEGKTEENKNVQNQQIIPQQKIDKMQAYTQITKQLGELRKASEQQANQQLQLNQQRVQGQPQQQPQLYQPRIQEQTQQQPQQFPNSFLTTAMNKKHDSTSVPQTIAENNAKKKDLSPATYVPNVGASYQVDAGTIDEINKKLARSASVERYAMKELDSLHTKNDAFDF